MGRTKRRRNRQPSSISLDHDPKIVNLKKWLSKLGWRNDSKLRLTKFPSTSRGLSSSKRIGPNDVLISIPYEAMITYNSFECSELWGVLKKFPKTFSTEEVFTMFLCIEKHKNEKSKWKIYLDTLPEVPLMPWMCKSNELMLLPGEILKKLGKTPNFEKIFSVLNSEDFLCNCCKIPLLQVITKENIYSNHVLFMTRCVYLHHKDLKRFSTLNIDEVLTDEPNMVLCPLLDMFNHSTNADAKLEFKQKENSKSFFLHVVTQCSFKRGSELFFSYGKHDNLSLFCYYGFYFQSNDLDFIEFTKNDLEALGIPQEKLGFIQEKNLNDNMIWHVTQEPSFNLVIVAYISSTENLDWRKKIFSGNLRSDDKKISTTLRFLLQNKVNYYKNKLSAMNNLIEKSDSLISIIEFCKHRLMVMEQISINKTH